MQEVPVHLTITEANITERLVREVMTSFYADVRTDPILGPVFRNAIGDGDWSVHIGRAVRFWLTAFRIDRSYHGRDFMPAHLRHGHIRAEHAPRWLALFDKAIDRLCAPKERPAFITIAHAMIENIGTGLAKRDGLQPDERHNLPEGRAEPRT